MLNLLRFSVSFYIFVRNVMLLTFWLDFVVVVVLICSLFTWLSFAELLIFPEVSVEVSGPSDAGTMYERIRLEKLPFVHRAVSITMDSKGRNFGVLQADPRTRYEINQFTKNCQTTHPKQSEVGGDFSFLSDFYWTFPEKCRFSNVLLLGEIKGSFLVFTGTI